MNKKIFIIEDEEKIRLELSTFLNRYGYETSYSDDFENIVEIALKEKPHIILLDINLPYYDGYYICREIRRKSNVPIIVVTSRNSEIDEVLSLSYGADDYITKPYNPDILLLHIEAILRRSKKEELFIYRNIYLNVQKCQLESNSKIVPLSKNEMRIFYYLLQHQGTIVSREEIMKYLWDTEEFIDDNTLTVNMSRIRKRLLEMGLDHVIETKKGLGYILIWNGQNT